MPIMDEGGMTFEDRVRMKLKKSRLDRVALGLDKSLSPLQRQYEIGTKLQEERELEQTLQPPTVPQSVDAQNRNRASLADQARENDFAQLDRLKRGEGVPSAYERGVAGAYASGNPYAASIMRPIADADAEKARRALVESQAIPARSTLMEQEALAKKLSAPPGYVPLSEDERGKQLANYDRQNQAYKSARAKEEFRQSMEIRDENNARAMRDLLRDLQRRGVMSEIGAKVSSMEADAAEANTRKLLAEGRGDKETIKKTIEADIAQKKADADKKLADAAAQGKQAGVDVEEAKSEPVSQVKSNMTSLVKHLNRMATSGVDDTTPGGKALVASFEADKAKFLKSLAGMTPEERAKVAEMWNATVAANPDLQEFTGNPSLYERALDLLDSSNAQPPGVREINAIMRRVMYGNEAERAGRNANRARVLNTTDEVSKALTGK